MIAPFLPWIVSLACTAQPLPAPTTDTATVRLHVSGMTCSTCPLTARLWLNRLDGVYSATVTLQDSLAVVHYDPNRLQPETIAEHLIRHTGFRVRVLPDTTTQRPRRSPS
jgi:copper chaperone CopZ